MAIRELPPGGPAPAGRRVSPLWVLLVGVVALLGVAVGWLLRDALDGEAGTDAAATAIGHVDDFPIGSLTEVDVGAEFYDPYGVEDATIGADGDPGPRAAVLLVTREEGGQVSAMYASSRWRGCRVLPIDRHGAVDMFGSGVPEWFSAGLVDPCHGGLYAPTGEQILGPGERGLDRFPVRYAADGTVLVDLTRPLPTGSLPPGGGSITVIGGGAATS